MSQVRALSLRQISLQVFRPPFEIGSIKLYKGYNARILKKRLKKNVMISPGSVWVEVDNSPLRNKCNSPGSVWRSINSHNIFLKK